MLVSKNGKRSFFKFAQLSIDLALTPRARSALALGCVAVSQHWQSQQQPAPAYAFSHAMHL
jgi:hypothetical protein